MQTDRHTDRRFRRMGCHHLNGRNFIPWRFRQQGLRNIVLTTKLHVITSQKTWTFTMKCVSASNLTWRVLIDTFRVKNTLWSCWEPDQDICNKTGVMEDAYSSTIKTFLKQHTLIPLQKKDQADRCLKPIEYPSWRHDLYYGRERQLITSSSYTATQKPQYIHDTLFS